MSKHLLKLAGWVLKTNWPPVTCPECGEGILRLDGDLVKLRDPASEAHLTLVHTGQAGPEELTGTFSKTLWCSDPECNRAVLIAGDWSYDIEIDPNSTASRWADYVRVRYVSPPLPIFTPPKKTPEKVTAAIHSASELLWINPNAAANQLRQAIEELLTSRGVRRFKLVQKKRSTKKRRIRLTAHERIKIYRDADTSHKDVADILEAVKWIGNSGSHDTALTIADVLEGAEFFEHALTMLYDTTPKIRQARVKQINTNRGIPRPKKSTS